MATIVKKRLQIQVEGRPGVDRSLIFCVGNLTAEERQKLRGVVLPARDRLDVMRKFDELRDLAWEAISEGKVGAFLDMLDQRTRPDFDPGPRFDHFVEEWLKVCVRAGDLRESQVEGDEKIVEKILKPYFGQRFLRDIDARAIDQFKAKMRQSETQYGKPYAPATINNFLSVLRRVFTKAVEWGVLDKNPIAKTQWLRPEVTPEETRPWWTPNEQAKAMAVLDMWKATEPEMRIAILTQLTTGLRFGELRALRKEDLDLQAGGFWIKRSIARTKATTPKNRRARFAALPAALVEELRVWMLRTEGQLLFPSERGGLIPNNSLNRAYKRLAGQAGVREITSHGARHSVGAGLAYLGAGNKQIAAVLGHRDLASTERYSHIRTEGVIDLVEARWAEMRGGK